MTTLVVAPNWLGDVVMALPALAAIRRHPDTGRLAVAARPSVAGLFALVPGVDQVLSLPSGGGLSAVRAFGRSVSAIRAVGADRAILLPNSLHAALLVARAGVPERWGYARDLRRMLLTRAVPRAKGRLHQAEYYGRLVSALGMETGPLQVRLELPPELRATAWDLLESNGWNGTDRLVGLAPGAAYGSAKQWPPEHFARLIAALTAGGGTACVLIGSRADAPVACEIAREAGKMRRDARSSRADPARAPDEGGAARLVGLPVVDLTGRTTLQEMAGVMARCRVCVSNDSGAMHVAAAVGVPVVAMFGSTQEWATSPLPFASENGTGAAAHAVLTSPAWCRPCMLRECPLDHVCMTGIAPERVRDEVCARLEAGGVAASP